MIEYKCPYCNQNSFAKSSKKSGKFTDWINVRQHWAHCKSNTKQYKIHPTKGLVPLNRKWDKQSIIKSIQLYVVRNGKIPEYRDFQVYHIDYPSSKTVQEHFKYFNTAIKAAGFIPNIQNGFGIDTYAKDGNLYRSSHEAYFVNTFLHGKYSYEYELPYGNGWFFDFYIKELGLYIELDGEIRPQRTKEKEEFHLLNGINCRIIKTSEIYKEGFSL